MLADVKPNSNAHARRKQGGWGPMHWLIVLSVSVLFAALSGCASRPRPSPAEPPRYQISENVRTGALCDGLRGRLPSADELDVGAALDGWTDETAFGACQQSRAVAAIAAGDALNAAWENYFATARPN